MIFVSNVKLVEQLVLMMLSKNVHDTENEPNSLTGLTKGVQQDIKKSFFKGVHLDVNLN